MRSFADILQLAAAQTEDEDEQEKIYELRRMNIASVHLVDRGANMKQFVIRKHRGDQGDSNMKTDELIGEVVVGEDGLLRVKKSELPTQTVVDSLQGAHTRLATLIDLAKSAGDDATELAKFAPELKSISDLIAGSAGSPAVVEKEGTAKDEPAKAENADDKPAPADASKEEEKKAETKKADDAAPAPASAVDHFDVMFDALHEVAKAGRKISSGRLDRFKKVAQLHKQAGDLMAELMKDLDPTEKKEVEGSVKKSEEKPEVKPEPIPDGRAASDVPAEIKKSKDTGWASGADLNE